jgi:acetolactate synthase-1/2/3 large subunit
MKVSDYVASFLHAQGVKFVFEVVGGMTTHLVDSIYRAGAVRLISMHHEQAAAFAADVAARLTGIPGVAMATSGPGAVNLLAGVGTCYFDSSPAVFITGQVNRSELKGSRRVRQLGFQETDIVSMARPITKATWQVESPEEVPELLEEAFRVALSGRRGPVLLDIPMDVQRADIAVKEAHPISAIERPKPDPRLAENLFAELARAERPLLLAGGGVRAGEATALFRSFVAATRTPVVFSLMGVDALPYEDPLRVGMLGTYGNRWANLAVARSDFLLVIGSRLDVRQTGSGPEAFRKGKTIFHVDVDPGEINNRVTECIPIVADTKAFLEAAVSGVRRQTFPNREEWLGEIDHLRRRWPDVGELRGTPGINPNAFMHMASQTLKPAAFVVDIGQHQMWAAQSLELGPEQLFVTSGGMGPMGFALPGAVGAALVAQNKPIVAIAGDGGFQLNIQELETLRYHKLPIKVIVMDNQCYGMVRQFQESYFEARYPGTRWGYSAPDFEEVARAYKIPSRTVEESGEAQAALRWLASDPAAPSLLRVVIDTNANAYPKIAFGKPITEMEP